MLRHKDELDVIPHHAEFNVHIERLRELALYPAVATSEDCDFPGPAERWYAEVDDCLFTLDVPCDMAGKAALVEFVAKLQAEQVIVGTLITLGIAYF